MSVLSGAVACVCAILSTNDVFGMHSNFIYGRDQSPNKIRQHFQYVSSINHKNNSTKHKNKLNENRLPEDRDRETTAPENPPEISGRPQKKPVS